MTRDNTSQTTAYYNAQAKGHKERTQSIDMSDLHEAFLALIPAGGRVLDAGCGPGRDALFFKNQGFDVTAMDAAAEMVTLSSNILGTPTLHLSFEEVVFEGTFDGIWASASLLHVSSQRLPEVFQKLCRALKQGGVLLFQRRRRREGRS